MKFESYLNSPQFWLPLTNDNERYLLSPELYIKLEPEVIDSDFESSGDGIRPSHAVEHDVDRWYEDFPHAVKREKISQRVEIAPFERFRVYDTLLMIA